MIDILEQASLEAGEIIASLFQKGITAHHKTSHHDLITEADIQGQKKIVESITKNALKKGLKEEEIGFIGEENLNLPKKYTFVIDPVDGTNNFASGFNNFCISIGVFENEKLIAGYIYNPITKISWYAEYTKGAHTNVNGRKEKLSMPYTPLLQSLIGTHSYARKSDESFVQKNVLTLNPLARGVRIMGSCAMDLVLLAQNSLQAAIYEKTKVWDEAAGNLIVQESGGVVVDWNGKKLTYDLSDPYRFYPFIASHPKLLPQILEYF